MNAQSINVSKRKNHKTDQIPVMTHFEDPNRVFFTSDTHFGDEKVLRLSERPFSSVEEMDQELIRRWNDTVPEDGIVFHLGDFGFGKYKRGHELLKILHGEKYLILGNHDQNVLCRGHVSQFKAVAPQMYIMVDDQHILLNHCPMLCYPKETAQTWQLFGHVHSGPYSTKGNDMPRLQYLWPYQYDVGVDNNDFRPISFVQLQQYFKNA